MHIASDEHFSSILKVSEEGLLIKRNKKNELQPTETVQ
jgi:hypothetical protein